MDGYGLLCRPTTSLSLDLLVVHCWCCPHVSTLGRHITRRWNWSNSRRRSRDMKRLRSSWLAPQQPLGRKPWKTHPTGWERTNSRAPGWWPPQYLLYFFCLDWGWGLVEFHWWELLQQKIADLRTAHRSFQSATLLHLLHLLWKPVSIWVCLKIVYP